MTPKKVIHCLAGMFWYGFAGIAVVAAVLLTVARLLLPLAENYRAEAEQALSEYAGQPIRVAELKAKWAGFEPQLHFSDVRLYDKNNKVVLFEFKDARMGIDLFSSIRNRDFVPSSFTISGVALSVTRHADKSLSVAGLLDNKKESKQDYSKLVFEWLLRQPDIGIESSSVTWTDIPLNEKELLFSDVNFRLRNYADVHQIDANVNLPERLGKTIKIAAEMQGTAADISAWHGDVYVNAKQLVLPAWWRKPVVEDVNLAEGHSNLELWGKWKNNSLGSLEGSLSLSNLVFSGEHAAAIKFIGLNSALSWHQNETDWSLHLGGFSPITKEGAWPASQFSFLSNRPMQRFVAVLGYVKLSDVLPVVNDFELLDKEDAKTLNAIQPTANLHDLSFVKSKDETSNQWHVDSRFSGLTTQAWNGMPGVKDLAGNFALDNNKGSLHLDSNNIVLDMKGLLRKPIDITRLVGNIQWQKDESGLSLQATELDVSNADITIRAQMDLSLPNKGSPVIELLADIENADGSQVYKYLPLPVLSDKTIAWLDKSIVQGFVPSGKVVLRGPLDKFPFDHGEGRFETRFDVVNAKLDYEPGWPAISEMQGEVIFKGRGLDIIGHTGRILDAKVHNVTAHITDLEIDDPLLELRGDVESSTQDIIEYVVASNLAEGYGKELRRLESSGDINLKLEIDIPMVSGKGTVLGKATLKDAKLGIKGNDIQLTKINGKVLVSNEGLQGDGIDGNLFETPVKIKLSHSDDASTALSIKAKGQFDLNKLIKDKFAKQIPLISKGETEWLANLSFRNPDGDTHPVVLELSSELKGVSVNLPTPLAKEADAIIPLRFTTSIQDDSELQLEVDFGDDVSSIIRLRNTDKGMEYAGSSIAFGDALPIPPENDRLSIVGQLDVLSIDEWMAYANKAPWTNQIKESGDSLDWLEGVNIEVAVFTAMGSNFSLKRLRLEREDESWHTVIDADRVKGEIHIPYEFSTGTVKANFGLLKVDRTEDESAEVDFDPRELPSLALSIDQLIFDGVKLGTLNMTTSQIENGVVMDRLVIDGFNTMFIANGSWTIENDEQLTRLSAKLKTERFSALLADLGYSTGFEAGKSSNKAQLEWAGSPLQFSVAKLNGSMKIKINKGQLLDISPGAGRIFGLLSLQALPRRLTLDFSDLFKKGFSFDRIKGNFQLSQGDAYTTDLYLDGPAARIDVLGRAGLVVHDYDQLITVTPDVTGGLPLAGALLGGPIAGGVVFALDKILRSTIDDITRYQYTVTGSWDDPKVEKLENVALDKAAE
ncbi:MAG: TIGR02099 family protein [Sulfuriflexus sp.]|nr:TIGR02099 family protein [Sulfuriflexus sp.]